MPKYHAIVPLPTTVAAFFKTLAAHTSGVQYVPHGTHATVTLDAPDLYDLATEVRSLEVALATATGVRQTIDRPDATDEPYRYRVNIDFPEDVSHFFSLLTGPGAIVEVTATAATVALDADDDYDLANTVNEIETEMNAWFTDGFILDRPLRVA